MSQFTSLREYELLIYTLPQQFASIANSTLVVARRGRHFAEVTGEIMFTEGFRLKVYERLLWRDERLSIEDYGYETWQHEEKLYWYDSQPHPNDPALAATHPHHKHVAPDIKHHRIPAPDLSFTAPNLPVLIREIETALLRV